MGEVEALAAALYFVVPPARLPIAREKLHARGARMIPEIATLKLVSSGPKHLGSHAPQQVVRIEGAKSVTGQMRVSAVRALTAVLDWVPKDQRAPMADKLHGLGMVVVPELSGGLVADEDLTRESGIEFLRANGLDELADRVESGETPTEAERAEMKARIPEHLQVIREQLDSLTPEDLA